MALATWWRGDTLPRLLPLSGLRVDVASNRDWIARLTSLTPVDAGDRLRAGHRVYVAALDGEPAAYGWVATLSASIGELGLDFALPSCDRYLWDFVTLPRWRGRGIDPRLLQGIIEREGPATQRFWIIHAPENGASGSGIAKAGFTPVSDLSFLNGAGVGAVAIGHADRARLGATLLGVSFFEAIQSGNLVSPCWRCVIERHASDGDEAGGGRPPPPRRDARLLLCARGGHPMMLPGWRPYRYCRRRSMRDAARRLGCRPIAFSRMCNEGELL